MWRSCLCLNISVCLRVRVLICWWTLFSIDLNNGNGSFEDVSPFENERWDFDCFVSSLEDVMSLFFILGACGLSFFSAVLPLASRVGKDMFQTPATSSSNHVSLIGHRRPRRRCWSLRSRCMAVRRRSVFQNMSETYVSLLLAIKSRIFRYLHSNL